MKNIKIFKGIFAAAVISIAFTQCNIEPIYYSEITEEVYSSSSASVETEQIKVWQIIAVPINFLRSYNGNLPMTYFPAPNALTADEMVMPSRNGDWYDGGFYMNLYQHDWGPSTSNYAQYSYEYIMNGITTCWNTYQRLQDINFDAIEFESGTKEWMLAQTKATIAYLYILGLDQFGGLSLYANVQEGTSSTAKPRATDREVFDFIEKTCKEIIPVLYKRSNTAFNGYFTQGAAAAMLARIYFNAKPYIGESRDAECEAVCNDIKDGVYGEYYLEPDYKSVFGWNNELSPEFIFGITSVKSFREVKGGRAEYGTHYNTMIYLDNQEALSWNGYCLTPSLDINGKNYRYETGNLGGPFKLGCPYDKFEDNDIRKQNYLYYGGGKYEGMFLAGQLINPLTGKACTADGTREYKNGEIIPMVDQIAQLCPDKDYGGERKEGAMFAEENSGVRIMKFSPIPNDADNSIRFNPDIPLIRYAEIEFMLAELAFNKGDLAKAAGILNAIRARYFTTSGGDPNPVTVENLDKYRLADEWLIEFLCEARRRTDLIRWGMFTTEAWWDHPADGPGKEYLNRFPIPYWAIEQGLTQNPGY
ncbi:MAG: RagB/SusD family nutrient uptake outer membrane protein [Tannerella sp.]|jgi:hypothetical protein|nr:RagB/SusD family nutrient uptake outer membrane protein [Tannerella sp.]